MIVINKRILLIFVITVLISIVSVLTTYCISSRAENEVYTVIVDAGHGSPDGGAVGVGGTLEKDINLAIAMKLSEVLEGKGIRVIMTRRGDDAIYSSDSKTLREMKKSDMSERLSIMKKSNADLFISIHMNSFTNKSANGLHIFYSRNHPEVEELAVLIQEKISDITKAKTHAVKTADEKLFLMKNPPIPSILAECGFISNADEEKKLNDEDYQLKIAWAIGDVISNYARDSE